MDRQTTMFEEFHRAEIPHTDHRLPKEALPRLGGQNGKILARLRQGKATNLELEKVSGSRRINSRIADCRKFLRAERLTIVATAVDTTTGIYQYEIVPRNGD